MHSSSTSSSPSTTSSTSCFQCGGRAPCRGPSLSLRRLCCLRFHARSLFFPDLSRFFRHSLLSASFEGFLLLQQSRRASYFIHLFVRYTLFLILLLCLRCSDKLLLLLLPSFDFGLLTCSALLVFLLLFLLGPCSSQLSLPR